MRTRSQEAWVSEAIEIESGEGRREGESGMRRRGGRGRESPAPRSSVEEEEEGRRFRKGEVADGDAEDSMAEGRAQPPRMSLVAWDMVRLDEIQCYIYGQLINKRDSGVAVRRERTYRGDFDDG